MSGLDTLSGIDFEKLIGQLLERMGFRAQMTKATGDGGIDIVATLDRPLVGGRYLIQCKRYSPDSPVGAATVREFYGALTADHGAVKGILITTSGFTAQAIEFARGLSVELIGREQLEQWLAEHGLQAGGLPATPGTSEHSQSPALDPVDRATALLGLAPQAMGQSNYGQGAKWFRELTQLQPDNAEAWLQLGICYYFVRLHDDQTQALREAVRLKPDLGEAWFWLAMGLHRLHDLDGGLDAVRRALEIEPRSVQALLERGHIYRDKGDLESALSAYEEATKLQPDSHNAWHFVGVARYDLKRNSDGAMALREALRIDPNNRWTWAMLCQVYARLADFVRFQQALTRLGELDPAQARELRGIYVFNREPGDEGNRVIVGVEVPNPSRRGLRPPPTTEQLFEDGKTYLREGHAKAALLILEETARRKPEDPEVWWDLGLVRKHMWKNDEAVAALREAVRLNPSHTQSWNVLRDLYKRLGNDAGVLEAQSRLGELLKPTRSNRPLG